MDQRIRDACIASVAGLALLAAQCAWVLPFVADDALISLRYVQRLVAGDGLTFTDGERVEGYSNLLLVLLTAVPTALGVDPIIAVRVVTSVGAGAAVCAVAWWGARQGLGAALFGAGALGGALGLGVWAMGGLEQPLLAGLIAGALVLCLAADERADVTDRRWAGAGVLLALGCLTRPDAPLFVAVVTGWALPRGGRVAATVCAPGVVAVLGQLAFRLAYYGDWVPNPAHVKVPAGLERLGGGAIYVGEGLLGLGILLALAAVGAWRAPSRARWLLLALAGVWLAYVVFVGGDIFPGRRHLVVALVPMALLATWASPPGAWGIAAAVGATVLHVGLQDRADPAYGRARLEAWEWECADVARPIGAGFRDRAPLLAVNAAGCWPYFSGLPALDTLGLNDRHIAKSPPRGDHLGHDRGDGAYVLSREPDLVIFGVWHGSDQPGYPGDRQLWRQPGFREGYRLVRFETRRPRRSAWLWVRTDSPRIGPDARPDGTIVVHPWLIADRHRGVTALVEPDGRMGVRMGEGTSTRFTVELPAGTWTAELDADGDPTVSIEGAPPDTPATVTLSAPTPVSVTLDATGPATVRQMRLVPAPGSE